MTDIKTTTIKPRDRITAEELVLLVRELAAENPDFVYTKDSDSESGCFYYPTEGNPCGCIIGAALRNAGVTVMDDQSHIQAERGVEVLDCVVGQGRALFWLQTVQTWQDRGESWSEAVKIADGKALPWIWGD